MPFVRVWIHLIWTTKNREPLMDAELRQNILGHISENAVKKDIYIDCINGVADHVHALISLGSDQTIAKVAQLLKGESSFWVNKENLTRVKFKWQDEFIAVSVSESMVESIRNYIKTQEEHHKKKTFAEEYDQFLVKYGFTEYKTS